MGLQQRDNVTATDLDNKPRPLAGFTILQMIGLLAGLLLAAGVWSLLPPIRDITGAGQALLIVHVMLATSVFALVAFVVIAADADGAEPFARHYWAYLTRRHRYTPRPTTGRQRGTSGRSSAAATGNRTTLLACGAITLVLIAVTGLDLILVGAHATAPPRTRHNHTYYQGRVVPPVPATARARRYVN